MTRTEVRAVAVTIATAIHLFCASGFAHAQYSYSNYHVLKFAKPEAQHMLHYLSLGIFAQLLKMEMEKEAPNCKLIFSPSAHPNLRISVFASNVSDNCLRSVHFIAQERTFESKQVETAIALKLNLDDLTRTTRKQSSQGLAEGAALSLMSTLYKKGSLWHSVLSILIGINIQLPGDLENFFPSWLDKMRGAGISTSSSASEVGVDVRDGMVDLEKISEGVSLNWGKIIPIGLIPLTLNSKLNNENGVFAKERLCGKGGPMKADDLRCYVVTPLDGVSWLFLYSGLAKLAAIHSGELRKMEWRIGENLVAPVIFFGRQ